MTGPPEPDVTKPRRRRAKNIQSAGECTRDDRQQFIISEKFTKQCETPGPPAAMGVVHHTEILSVKPPTSASAEILDVTPYSHLGVAWAQYCTFGGMCAFVC